MLLIAMCTGNCHDSHVLPYKVVGDEHFEVGSEDHMIVSNPPDVCQVVEVRTECDDQPSSMSQLYPLQISPVSSYAGKQPWTGK